MRALTFETQPPIVDSNPYRSDIACFVGFVTRRPTTLPGAIDRWLRDRGWDRPEHGRFPYEDLDDVPVPIDTWEVFDALFAWEQRDFTGRGQLGPTYLGTAVRSFFAQGGRKCYVIRVGDPWPFLEDNAVQRQRVARRLDALIPGYASSDLPEPVAQASWRGAAHVLGLSDVSFLCLPDLPDIVSVPTERIAPTPIGPTIAAQFVECTEETAPGPPSEHQVRLFQAPHTDAAGYEVWSQALRQSAELLKQHHREVQLVAAIPLPESGTVAESRLMDFLVAEGEGPLGRSLDALGISSAFVQLVFPWVQTVGSRGLPQQLEPPDAILAGLLAQNALARGAYRSAANLPVSEIYAAEPALSQQQTYQPVRLDGTDRALIHRVSLLGQTPTGWRLLSDVTTSLDEAHRPASSNRLTNVLIRAARLLGESLVFAAANEALWRRVTEAITQLLAGLYQVGALRGQTIADAFQVRCDRSTMTQADIDNGRVITEIRFDPAMTIEQITVVLAMDEGGQVSLVTS